MVDGKERITECAKCGEPRLVGYHCKPCKAAYRAANREKITSYNASYNSANREKIVAHRVDVREKTAVRAAKWRASYPEKTLANNAVSRAIRSGELVVGPCDNCDLEPAEVNGRQRIEAHHHLGYDPEHALDVQWLCVPCHHLT